jgi:PAS domain S-box-containing protein
VGNGPLVSDPPEARKLGPASSRGSDSTLQSVLRAGYGALLGTVPLLVSMLMRPSHRSPYLLAYPAVILSAWAWGLPASVACGAVSGLLLEYFIFKTGQITLSPVPNGWLFRETIFLGGSILVGVLTRSAARQRQRSATANLNHKLSLAKAEAAAASQKALATELALENEVRARMALDGANVGLWEWDIATTKSKWSHGYYRLHGLEPRDSASYDLWRRCVHPDDIERVESAVHRAIAERLGFHEEYRIQLPGGAVRWVACQGTAVIGPDGNVTGISGFAGDVTRRKLADLALLQNEKMVIAGRLIATIAHEINNPLDAAMNILYLIRSGVSPDEQTRLLEDASLQLERISQISRQTLNFSRASVRPSLLRPSVLVDEALRLLGPKLRLAQLEVVTEIRGDSEIYCERREVQQILANILNNAIEATPGPGILRVRIADSVNWSHRQQRGIRITIAETGAGMSREALSRISEPFFTTKEGTGTGLGMWVVHELIRKQNGAISISSSTAPSHHGTAVSLFIPFAVEPVPPTTAPAVTNQTAL